MISIDFAIRLPFHWFKEVNHPGLCLHGKVSKHKAWEVQIGRFSPSTVVQIDLDTRMAGSDHAGLKLELSLFGLFFAAQIHDVRHWNYKEKRWQTEEEEIAEQQAWEQGPVAKHFTQEELRAKVFDALEIATIPGTSDALALQSGNITYDGEFSLDEFVRAVFADDEEEDEET